MNYKKQHMNLRTRICKLAEEVREMRSKSKKPWPKIESFGLYMLLLEIIQTDNQEINEQKRS
jgi:hypothetical protein|tara:strand:+ start:52 stop:237 length:186 start_codon:yes stop_codon:yes gene_type:complete